jgi:hypothetical protein
MGTIKKPRKKSKQSTGVNRERALNRRVYKKHLLFINCNCLEQAEVNGHYKLNLDDIGYILDTKNMWSVIAFAFYKNHDGEEAYIWKRKDYVVPYTRCEVAMENMYFMNELTVKLKNLDTNNPYKLISTGFVMSPDHSADLEDTIESTVDFLADNGAYNPLICRLIDEKRENLRNAAGLKNDPMIGDIYKGYGTKTKAGGKL